VLEFHVPSVLVGRAAADCLDVEVIKAKALLEVEVEVKVGVESKRKSVGVRSE